MRKGLQDLTMNSGTDTYWIWVQLWRWGEPLQSFLRDRIGSGIYFVS